MDNYITPILSNYSSLDELLQEKTYDGNFSLLDVKHQFKQIDFFNNGSFFVLGEPGVGKSTLLKQLHENAKSKGIQSTLIKLDTISTHKIDEVLDVSNKNWDKEVLIILDALDEVDSKKFDLILNEIFQFHRNHQNLNLIISCRTHYLSKSRELVSNFQNFKFIRINLFNMDQVSRYLEKEIPDNTDLIDSILSKTVSYSGFNVLNTPRYLNVLVQLLKKRNGKNKLISYSKVDFFEEFIYHKLDEAQLNKNEAILTKRVLEKLALIMEIYQVNKITKDELITFLDEIRSNVSLIFLNTSDLDKFIERVLKSTDSVLEFDNTEFQEYLAAKELIRIGDKSQVLYDLIIEPTFKNISTNWFDVLKYVLEIDSRQLLNLIDYLSNNINRYLSDDLITLILSVNPDVFTNSEKTKIFATLFHYHKRNSIHISRRIINSLVSFYTNENEDLLSKISILNKDKIHLTNQLFTVAHLIRVGKYGRKTQILKYLNRNTQKVRDENILYTVLYIYQYNKSLQEIENIESIKKINYGIYKAFINTCISINPNDDYTLKHIIQAVRDNKVDTTSWINDIEDIDAIRKFIIKINSSKKLLRNCITQEHSYYSFQYDNIFKKIRQNWDKSWHALLKKQVKFYLNEFDLYELNNDFHFNEAVKLLRDFDNNFLSYFLVKETHQYYSFNVFIAESITKNNIIFLHQRFTSEMDASLLINIFYWIKANNKRNYKSIKSSIKKLFPSLFNHIDTSKPKDNKDFEKEQKTKEFNRLIEPSPGKYDTHVFKYFISNHEIILANCDSKKINKLKLIILNALKQSAAFNSKLTIEKLTPTSARIRTNNRHLLEFSSYIKAGLLLGISNEMLKYRDFLIEYLPVIINTEYKEDVQNFIGNLNDEDKNLLLKSWLSREDDLLKYSVSDLAGIIQKFNLPQLLPILKGFVNLSNVEVYTQVSALKTIAEMQEDEKYLIGIFNSSKDNTELRELSELANEYLITKYRNSESILWRINEIKVRITVHERNSSENGFFSRSYDEVDSMLFSNCILNLRDINYTSHINELLSISFSIVHEKKYFEYASYLQKVVFGYYKELKYMYSLTPLRTLTEFFGKIASKEKWRFGSYIKDLENEYSQLMFKPTNIIDCTKKYNEIKGKSYLKVFNEVELLYTLKEIINVEINSFIQNEGFFKSYEEKGLVKVREDFMQKSMKIQLENLLLKKGFRLHDIIREPQTYSNVRPDFIISYGFIGPILLEIKFITNPEVVNVKERKAYINKLENTYRKGLNAKFGIYLILQKDQKDNSDIKEKILKEYSVLKNWDILFLNCYSEIQSI